MNMHDEHWAGVIPTYPVVAQISPRGYEMQLLSVLSQSQSRKQFLNSQVNQILM
jgi:hypothetical protein